MKTNFVIEKTIIVDNVHFYIYIDVYLKLFFQIFKFDLFVQQLKS